MPIELPSLSRIRQAIFGRPEEPSNETGNDNRHDVFEGRVIAGRFEIIRRLGSGGMGTVYLARQTSMNRQVAIKLLHSDKTRDNEARSRFRLEAAAVSRLKNPHTITVYDFGEDENGELFLVMEYLEGRLLSDVLRETGPIDSALVVGIADQILDSLAEAHAAGILHRDLKPENIFVSQDLENKLFVKVLDFGIAKVLGASQPDRTWPGVVFGTPAYMSPEQVMGRKGDQRSDLYSLAVVMFELLTGALPVTGRTPIEIGVKKVRNKPPSLEEINPGRAYPDSASDFMLKALSPNPEDRPLTAREFRRAMMQAFVMQSNDAGVWRGNKLGVDVTASFSDLADLESEVTKPIKPLKGGRRKASTTEAKGTHAKTSRPITPTADQSIQGTREKTPVVNVHAILRDTPLSGFDRRSSHRASKLIGVRCFYDGGEFRATASDLSASGGFLASQMLPVAGHRIIIVFPCPGNDGHKLSMIAEVVRLDPGSGDVLDVRGFAVRWIRLRARGELACLRRFLDLSLGIELNTTLADTANAPQWEYLFEDSKLGRSV